MTGFRGHLVVFLLSFLVLWLQELLNKLLRPVAAVLVGAAAQTRDNRAIFFYVSNPSAVILLCNACHSLQPVGYSANLVTFVGSLRHCSKLASRTFLHLLFKAFHYYLDQCNKNIWFGGKLPWCTEIKSLLLHLWNAVLDDSTKELETKLVSQSQKSMCVIFLLQVYQCRAFCDDQMWLCHSCVFFHVLSRKLLL